MEDTAVKDILVVTGGFNSSGGKSSFLCHDIRKAFTGYFNDRVYYLDGGYLSTLDDEIKKINNYKIIVWIPEIESPDKNYLSLIKAINKTCILVQSKRNDEDKYSTFQIIEPMFKMHSNLCLVINSEDPSHCKIRILDPLGNLWYEGRDITKACLKLAILISYLADLKRVPSTQRDFFNDTVQIEEKFIDIIHFYA